MSSSGSTRETTPCCRGVRPSCRPPRACACGDVDLTILMTPGGSSSPFVSFEILSRYERLDGADVPASFVASCSSFSSVCPAPST